MLYTPILLSFRRAESWNCVFLFIGLYEEINVPWPSCFEKININDKNYHYISFVDFQQAVVALLSQRSTISLVIARQLSFEGPNEKQIAEKNLQREKNTGKKHAVESSWRYIDATDVLICTLSQYTDRLHVSIIKTSYVYSCKSATCIAWKGFPAEHEVKYYLANLLRWIYIIS